MLAAISSAEIGNDVTILEKMNTLGRKLLITGKGRCNITSSLDISEFINNVPGNGKFLYSAFKNFDNKDIIELLEKQGVKVKNERGNRIFPLSDKSQDVLKALIKKLNELNVKIVTNCRVDSISIDKNIVNGVYVVNNLNSKKEFIEADKVIVATGGKSYPDTGSTGDGYILAQNIGHTITAIKPSLVPLEAYEVHICKSLKGLSLRNVSIKLMDVEKRKIIYEDFGEMLFTHFGVSGPTILSASAHLLRYKNLENLLNNRKIKLLIDLKPALSEEKLDLRIRRDFEEMKNKKIINSLDKLLPKKMIIPIIEMSQINPNKKNNEITKEERLRMVKNIKKIEITISKFRPIENAIITAGGVSIKEINSKTMESKLVKGVYFAGEVIDVDAYTGGFNLQIAYSTGYTAGKNFSKDDNNESTKND